MFGMIKDGHRRSTVIKAPESHAIDTRHRLHAYRAVSERRGREVCFNSASVFTRRWYDRETLLLHKLSKSNFFVSQS